jgi:hypothetical protein
MADEDAAETSGRKKVLNRLVWVLVFVAGFVATKELARIWSERDSLDEAAVTVNREIEEMRSRAARTAGDPAQDPAAFAQAFRSEALKKSSERLASAPAGQKASRAAGQFMGFYLANVRTRAAYCRARDVDISPFVEAFSAGHASLYAKSRTILSRGRYTADELEAKLLEALAPTFSKTIADDMTGLAAASKITEADACRLLSDRGAEFAGRMLLSKSNPLLYEALRSAQ